MKYPVHNGHNQILTNLERNARSLKTIDATIGEKIESVRTQVLRDFVQNVGCMPSEAELVLIKTTQAGRSGLQVKLRQRTD